MTRRDDDITCGSAIPDASGGTVRGRNAAPTDAASGLPGEEISLKGKRLLILFPHLTCPGGALIYTLKLAAILAGRGATVGILALCADPARIATPPGVEIVSLHGPLTSSLRYWALLPWWQMRINSRIRDWQPDLLIPQVFPANWWGWLFRVTGGKTRLLWICHEPSAFIHSLPWIRALVPCWKRWLALLLRPILAAADISLSRRSDRVVANSVYTSRTIRSIYGREADAIAYPGVELDKFRPGSATGRSGIITVAKLTKFKRVDFLLRVFALVRERHPGLVYHIVGRGEEEASLKALAEELGIASSVVFHGGVDDGKLAELCRSSILFLHGSVEEPFGMAPLEAIACGTPVVAHKSGGPLEIVDDSCGRLIDSLSVERWSEEIGNFIDLIEAGQANVDRVAARAGEFAWEKTLSPIVALATKLTAAPSPADAAKASANPGGRLGDLRI